MEAGGLLLTNNASRVARGGHGGVAQSAAFGTVGAGTATALKIKSLFEGGAWGSTSATAKRRWGCRCLRMVATALASAVLRKRRPKPRAPE